jgi:hypothetical protein
VDCTWFVVARGRSLRWLDGRFASVAERFASVAERTQLEQ